MFYDFNSSGGPLLNALPSNGKVKWGVKKLGFNEINLINDLPNKKAGEVCGRTENCKKAQWWWRLSILIPSSSWLWTVCSWVCRSRMTSAGTQRFRKAPSRAKARICFSFINITSLCYSQMACKPLIRYFDLALEYSGFCIYLDVQNIWY